MVKQIEACVEALERCPDPATRETARQLVQALLAFHAEGIAAILKLGTERGGEAFTRNLAGDPAVSQLLLLHGLHPADLETRVKSGLEKARPRLQAHGGNVEFVGIEDGRVRVRLVGNCHGCPSSTLTLRGAIEEALVEAAPDAIAIEMV